MVTQDKITIISTERTGSTNDWLRENGEMDDDCLLKVAVTSYQSAGRGQKGNHWESQEGANLLFSILSRPMNLKACDQFRLSQAISLAVTDVLTAVLDDKASELSVKWPNDIYWEEKKLGGILIENRLQGAFITDCIIGVGLNVNQTRFYSDAPNPISIRGISGLENSTDELLQRIISRFTEYYIQIESGSVYSIHDKYMKRLFRRDGFHIYCDENGEFSARITDVLPSGILVLEDTEGHTRQYEFKQVRFILGKN